jgi:hypothetical protein
MLLRTSVAAFSATISLGLWSEACADWDWPATKLNVPPTASTDNYWQKDVTVVAITPDGTWGVATEPTIPPPPQVGDASEHITFTSVGRALTRWEEFEVVFASLVLAQLSRF